MKKCCYSVSLAPRPLWEWVMLRFGYSVGTVRCPQKVGQC